MKANNNIMLQNLKYIKLIFGIMFFCMLIINISFPIGIGTIPGVLDLGEVKRGQEIIGTFYITSTLNRPMKIALEYRDPHTTIYYKEKRRSVNGYDFIPAEASEESIREWVEFPKSTVLINPKEVHTINTKQGTIKYNSEFRFIVKIPEDAEPGYHAGSINLVPTLGRERGQGTSISTIGIVRPLFVFKVAGNAIRKGRIIYVDAKRLDKNTVRVDVLFKNEGTVTITGRLINLVVYDDYGYRTGNIALRTSSKVKPGETVVLSAIWRNKKGIKSGSYHVDAVVDYITDKAEYTGYIKVVDKIYVPSEGKVIEKKPRKIPWWFLLIIMGLIALYIYWKM